MRGRNRYRVALCIVSMFRAFLFVCSSFITLNYKTRTLQSPPSFAAPEHVMHLLLGDPHAHLVDTIDAKAM